MEWSSGATSRAVAVTRRACGRYVRDPPGHSGCPLSHDAYRLRRLHCCEDISPPQFAPKYQANKYQRRYYQKRQPLKAPALVVEPPLPLPAFFFPLQAFFVEVLFQLLPSTRFLCKVSLRPPEFASQALEVDISLCNSGPCQL